MDQDQEQQDQQHEPDTGQAQAEQDTERHDSGQENTEGDPLAKVRHEAAAYRRKLRDAEKERDALAEQISGMRRGEAERLAAEHLADPSDLWRSGIELDSLLGEDGSLDPDAVKVATGKLVAERPHYRKPAPDFDGGPRGPVPEQGPSFGQAIKGAR